MGTAVAGQLKRIIPMVSEHAHYRVQFGKRICEFPLVQEKIFDIVQRTYAMESMAYMTAGQLDLKSEDGVSPDCSVEAAMVKVNSACF